MMIGPMPEEARLGKGWQDPYSLIPNFSCAMINRERGGGGGGGSVAQEKKMGHLNLFLLSISVISVPSVRIEQSIWLWFSFILLYRNKISLGSESRYARQVKEIGY